MYVMKKKTLYEFLGVEPEASPEEIKTAAQYLAKKFHPSKYPNNPRVAARFKKIKLVYNTLANPQKRAAYDAALTKKRTETAAMSEEQLIAPTNNLKTKENTDLWLGEKIIYRADIHWLGYLKALLTIAFSAYFLVVNPSLLKMSGTHLWYIKLVLSSLLLLGVLTLLHTMLEQFTTTIMITSKRILARFGIISKTHFQMTHTQLKQLQIDQGLLGKILNFGTLQIKGNGDHHAGEINLKINHVAAPQQFKEKFVHVTKRNI